MWDMAKSALTLFFRGQLFADPKRAYGLLIAGIIFTAMFCIALTVAGLPVWAAVFLAGFAGGALQPFLFKKIRFR
jgi:hypothetical protein